LHHTKSGTVSEGKKIEMKISQVKESGDATVSLELDGKSMEDELKGLVDELKKESFVENGKLSVELKDGNLIINGKQQPEEVLKKLTPYLNEKKKINFSINVDEK
jgi:translation initiation factor 2 beta subunit (eIF-2beta)/eIF-5